MFFLVIATDRADALDLRMRTKAAHSAHLDSAGAGVRVLQTGPWLGPDGQEAGSVLVLQAERQSEVEAFLAVDPYAKAGLFASVVVRPWKWGRGNPYLATTPVPSPGAT